MKAHKPTAAPNSTRLIRPLIRRLHGYVPGEQPKIRGLIKLNTNENPYPPSPKVLDAIRNALDGRLRLYPNPTAQPLRLALARWHRCAPENIFVGNGSDEILALATRAFVEPAPTKPPKNAPHTSPSRATVQFFQPSYSLYPVLAAIHGTHSNPVPLGPDFTLPPLAQLRRANKWDFAAALTLITTPNAPSGCAYLTTELEVLCTAQKGVVLLDEAYVDFARENALRLALDYPHVLLTRTFSKAYSLCFQRVGYCIGHPNLIAALDKIRDSYNVNGLGQIAALTTLSDLPYYRANFRRIIASRQHLTHELNQLGFSVCPSQTNFIFTIPPRLPAYDWLQRLRQHKILVRWFPYPQTNKYLRITIGAEPQIESLLSAVKKILDATRPTDTVAGRRCRAAHLSAAPQRSPTGG